MLERLFTYAPFSSDQSQTYRILPIISGVLIPFLVLLSIPSLTEHWYVRTEENVTVETRPNPLLLVVGMALSMACGALANICLVLRFAERRVKKMTLLCIIFLSMHELINIPAVTIFGVIHRFNDGFTYGQSFWMTVCSTLVSTATNITLIIDYSQTKNFAASGSGLTHKQRSLVIIIIVLLCYLTFGSLAQTFMLRMTFIDALYFTVVSIETIGFGDIHPTSTGTRIFISMYISGGILNLALAVALSREALLEAAAVGFRERVRRLRARQRKRHIRVRWRAAVKWRLQAKNLPVWIIDDRVAELRGDSRNNRMNWWKSTKLACSLRWKKLSIVSEDRPCYAPYHKHLNLNALTEAQLEAAALEAGAPLTDLLPSRLKTPTNDAEQPQPLLTHMRIGGMVSLLGQFAIAFTHSPANPEIETITNLEDTEDCIRDDEKPVRERIGFTRTLTMQDEESFLKTLEAEERIAFIARLSIACFIFFVFWGVGSAIFMKTEGWGFGSAAYFCFVAFSTVGYGDFAPKTQAGRSIFVVWALLGVATVTILISILGDAYSKTYKSAIRTLVNTGTEQEVSPRFSPPALSQFGNVTFPSSPNGCTCKMPSEPLIQQVKFDVQKRNNGNMTAISLEILRHVEKLQLLLNSVKDNEILEIEVYLNQVERTIQDIVSVARDGLETAESMV